MFLMNEKSTNLFVVRTRQQSLKAIRFYVSIILERVGKIKVIYINIIYIIYIPSIRRATSQEREPLN